jgi:nitrogen fixation/metabolism regulation signal transduction histidine kinase
MDVPLIRRFLPTATVALGGLLWLAGLLLLAQSAQNSTQFGRLHPWILMFNVAGLVVLVALLAVKLGQLVRDWRGNVIGSRLKARMVWIFGVLATLPILIVYFFAVQFLSRGIDSWFNVEIRQSLDDALVLSRAALEVRMREHLADTELIADELLDATGSASGLLESLRRDVGALELTLATGQGRVLGVSKGSSVDIVPESVPDEVLLQVRQGNPFVALEPQSSGGYLVRAAVAIRPAVPGQSMRVLQAMYPVSERLSGLADTVQAAYQQYGEKDYLRRPLKTSFILTLTIVLLLSLLAAWYGAIFTAQRLVQPIQDLVAGTRAVAKGDLDTRLPLTSHDEMGFLVHSFNDMTKRLRRARADQLVAQQVAEQERANLAVVLGNLSTGVIVLEPDLGIRSANRAAGSILGEDTSGWIGRRLDEVGAQSGLGHQLLAACQERLAAGQSAWREQFAFQPESGRRVLMCACSRLPGEGEQASGHVLVFDDITVMLQAQREAAWGEVARRLAHEIKNPLTPIRLSAERMRQKLMPALAEKDAQVLDRGTETIVQQVEAMKEMVNAFSEYARAPRIDLAMLDLNALIGEVAELYRTHGVNPRLRIDLDLDPQMVGVLADRGRIRQLLHNLLKNAVEALEAQRHGAIRVVTRSSRRGDDEFIELRVEDDGPGFQRDMLGRVFDPYVTSKTKGTGLGLAIVRKIVEEHGGHIEADNGAGGGACIRIELPVGETARRQASARDVRKPQEFRRERA